MIRSFRKPRFLKIFSVLMALLFINEIIFPTVAMALTGGPSQPEVESFAPIEATDMVDLFSGDFKYNIPLMDVDGYPININYNSNITMDQEASWVGLGWNLNPGVINRSMRGLPDEFCGDEMIKEFKIEKDETIGVSLGVGDVELFGFSPLALSLNLGIKWNTIKGYGVDFSASAALSLANLATWNENKGLSPKAKQDKKSAPWKDASLNERISRLCSSVQKYSNYATNGLPVLKDLELGPTNNSICRNPIRAIRYGILNKAPTFTPQIQTSVENTSSTYNGKVGVSLWGIDGNLIINGYQSEHKVIKNPTIVPAYGYMNTERGMDKNCFCLLDYNRENDGIFSENLTYLPLMNYTYDTYSILGQGLTGSFRPFKSAVDVVYDQAKYNLGSSNYFGIEAGFGSLFHVGVDKTTNNVYGVSGIWADNNYALPALMKNYIPVSNDYEKAYFKEAGEMNVEENDKTSDFYNRIGKENPINLKLSNIDGGLLNILNFQNSSFGNSIQRDIRAKRTTNISYLNPKDAYIAGVNKEIQSYPLLQYPTNSNVNSTNVSIIPRLNSQRKENHISEITVTKTDGSRYIYGIPAYNITQIESNFNVNATGQGTLDKGMVQYLPLVDDCFSNDKGIDHYYNKTRMPAYPHSYLLTAVLSTDYIDVTGDGPTDDDLGNYVKFNYSKLPQNYKWRSPLSAIPDMASYSKGIVHNSKDDKASYTYGEKEIWYVQTIETKNQIAEFYLTDRQDGCGVKNESGAIDKTIGSSTFLKRLEKISLFSKYDRKINNTNATPIKEVHFDYSYNLCKGIPNTTNVNGGKLTLTKIYFTYGNSKKGKFNAYKFEYDESNTISNPNYDNKAYDRWGNFMPFGTYTNYYQNNTNPYSYPLNASDWPYVNQEKIGTTDEYYADKYAAVWSLRKITLPSRGEINVQYEADDYAYVQNIRAMEMFKIAGVSSNLINYQNCKGHNLLYESNKTRLKLLFKLKPEHLNLNLSNQTVYNNLKDDYYNDIKDLYFNCNIKLDQENPSNEQVNGYGRIFSTEFVPIINSNGISENFGQIILENVNVNYAEDASTDMKTNPITKAGLNFCLNNAPYIVSDDDYPDVASYSSANFDGVISELASVLSLFSDDDKLEDMINDGNCKQIDLDKSWIRLRSPSYNKKGGGSRVKKIEISDGLKVNGISSVYGQEYNYKTDKIINKISRTISSGVAANEPGIGGDESALKIPIYKNDDYNYLSWEEKSYFEGPIGESFYPGPGVGYSKVSVKNLAYDNVNRHATGKVVHEFFTSRDFPVTAKFTPLDVIPYTVDEGNLVSSTDIKRMNTSQGYVVDCNDMHGKQNSVIYYAEGENQPISGEKYIYATSNVKTLDNEVSFMCKNGSITKGLLGVDIDLVSDFRASFTSTTSSKIKINTATLLFFFPIPIPTAFGSMSYVERTFKSAAVTKVINRKGILKEVQKFDATSFVTSKNLVYDYETGDVLETQTNNEYDDPIYSFTYPAHLVYDQMGLAYKNNGSVFNISVNNGKWIPSLSSSEIRNLIVSGDEFILYKSIGIPKEQRAWVLDVVESGTNKGISFVDLNGKSIPFGNYKGKIVRSGRRNMAATAIGSLTTLQNPIFNKKLDVNESSKILNATATVYNNVRKVYAPNVVEGDDFKYCKRSINLVFYELLEFINKLPHQMVSNITTASINLSLYPYSYYFGPLKSKLGLSNPITYKCTFSGGKYKFEISEASKIIVFEIAVPANFTNLTQITELKNFRKITTKCDEYNSYIDVCYRNNTTSGIQENCILTFSNLTNYYDVNIGENNSTVQYSLGNLLFKDETIIPKYSLIRCDRDSVNPYTYGVLGHWYPYINYAFLSSRNQTAIANGTNMNIRKDGYLNGFFPFWTNPNSGVKWQTNDLVVQNNAKWVAKDTVTIVNREGSEVENKDILNTYSSAVYAFNSKLPTAVAKNARMNEIANDGFEDYYVSDINYLKSSVLDPFFLNKDASLHYTNVIEGVAHTGKYSILLDDNYRFAINSENNRYNTTKSSEETLPVTDLALVSKFVIKCEDALTKFSLKSGKKYLLSFWMKDMGYNPDTLSSSIPLKIFLDNVAVSLVYVKVMKPIEGWQKVDVELNLSSLANTEIRIERIQNMPNVFLDDIRIQPYNASVKSYVYNDITLKLMAELDENNYATFYEYDEEGALARLKKETANGVFTIKEIKKSFMKQLQ